MASRRAWYSGRASAFQADDPGSIPGARSNDIRFPARPNPPGSAVLARCARLRRDPETPSPQACRLGQDGGARQFAALPKRGSFRPCRGNALRGICRVNGMGECPSALTLPQVEGASVRPFRILTARNFLPAARKNGCG